MSYAPIVKRVTPAVVTVSAAKTVENRNPLMDDPFFRRFFGPQFGGRASRRSARSAPASSSIRRPGRDQQPRHRRRRPGEDLARRQARVRGRRRAQGCAHRSRGAARQGRQGAIPGDRVRQLRRAAGRRRGAGDRQSVRRRPDRDPRHRLGGGAHPGRHLRLSVLHPDRRRDQSRQFRRRAGRHGRHAGRHQHRDLLALRRLAGRRLRHSGQHGAGGGGLGAHRRQRGQAALARRQAPGADARSCRRSSISSGRRRRWSPASPTRARRRAPA